MYEEYLLDEEQLKEMENMTGKCEICEKPTNSIERFCEFCKGFAKY